MGERETNQKLTEYFISVNPVTIRLCPAGWVPTPSGGRARSVASPRAAQVFRLIDQSSSAGNAPGPVRTGDGIQRTATHQLLGRWDAVMEVGDWWESNGQRFEISQMLPDNGYEKRAVVITYG